MTTLSRSLQAIGACSEAVEWSKDYKTLSTAWKKCERGDWMLWLCGKMSGEKDWPTRQQVVLAACDCADLALPLYEKKYPNDSRVRDCIAITRRWASGEATIEEVRSGRSDAAYAAYAAYADDAAYAAADAAYAAYAADAAAYAASADADAYADDAAYADAAYASASRLRECADICRKKLTIPAVARRSK